VADASASSRAAEKARRQEARAVVAGYHQEELRRLLDRVRAGFAQLDAGAIDEFELDDLIHRYKKAAARLWSFCGSSGSHWVSAANAIQRWRDQGASPRDWWEEVAPRGR